VSTIILKSDYAVTTIEDVQAIDVSDIQQPSDKNTSYTRCIVVFTQRGDTYKLWLEADNHKKLKLEKYLGDDWSLNPKPYKGSTK
jgi:nitrite reductase/ring-hydroxylating ferredoxin subunit